MAFWNRTTQAAQANGWQQQDQHVYSPGPQQQQQQQRPIIRRRKNAGGFWMGIIVVGVYIAAVVAFAFQTWGLVDTIFPSDNQFMKIATVICLDVMSIIFAATEMFYPFWSRSAKHLALGMWLVTFVGALIASVLYMYLSSIHLLHGVLDMSILVWAYAVVVLVMAADVLAITVGIRMEYGAHHPDEEQFYSPVYSPASVANIPQTQVQPENPLQAMAQLEALVESYQRANKKYSQEQLNQITGELLAIMEAKNTGPLSAAPVQNQNSTGATTKTSHARKAPQGAGEQTQK